METHQGCKRERKGREKKKRRVEGDRIKKAQFSEMSLDGSVYCKVPLVSKMMKFNYKQFNLDGNREIADINTQNNLIREGKLANGRILSANVIGTDGKRAYSKYMTVLRRKHALVFIPYQTSPIEISQQFPLNISFFIFTYFFYHLW